MNSRKLVINNRGNNLVKHKGEEEELLLGSAGLHIIRPPNYFIPPCAIKGEEKARPRPHRRTNGRSRAKPESRRGRGDDESVRVPCLRAAALAIPQLVGSPPFKLEGSQLPAHGDRVLHPGGVPAGAGPSGQARRAHGAGAAVVAPLHVLARPDARRRAGRLHLRRRARVGPAGLARRLRPAGAPGAVVAVRGTLLSGATFRRDVTDDLRFLAWDTLKGSVRFAGALAALRAAARRHGGAGNVCVGGHSLGAGFALQVGKALAKEGVFVECHVFNPPSVSLATSLRGFAETAGEMWGRVRSWLPYAGSSAAAAADASGSEAVKTTPSLERAGTAKWLPHLYINTNDYICCYYTDATVTARGEESGSGRKKTVAGGSGGMGRAGMARMMLVSKGPTKFLDAHGLQQWWADDVELQVALNHSKLIDRQLRSLYAPPPAAPQA